MKPSVKYWIFIIGVALSIFSVIAFSFIASWGHLNPDEQAFVEEIMHKLIPFPIIGGLVIFLIVGGMVSFLFRLYIIPILQLSEETRLISSVNAGHRIKPRGGAEVLQLIDTINDYACSFEQLQTEVDQKIEVSRSALNAERNRLAALMSELPNGVVVCNTDGQILLFNNQAQKFLTSTGDENVKQKPIGLGRSIFALVERHPILHGLDVLKKSLDDGKQRPVTGFMLPFAKHYLRFSMAPVSEQDGSMDLTGFVLTIEDIAPEIESDNRLESWLQTLIDDIERSLQGTRRAIRKILETPEMAPNELAIHRQTIDSTSATIQKRLDRTREEAARNIHTASHREEVLGRHLLNILEQHLEDRFGIKISGHITEDGWLNLDSYMAVQGIAFLAGRLKKRSNIEQISIELNKTGNNLAVEFSWEPERVKVEDVDSWQRTPLVTDRFQHTFSFRDFIARHEGALTLDRPDKKFCNGVTITLPAKDTHNEYSGSTEFEQRPVFYEFDLFKQRTPMVYNDRLLRDLTYVPFDLETTGLHPTEGDEIIQLGAIRIVNGHLQHHETIDQLVDPQREVPPIATEITGIYAEMLVGEQTVAQVLPEFRRFAEGAVLVAHNAAFDMRFLELKEVETRTRFGNPVLDTLLLSTVVHPNLDDHTLDGIAGRMNIPIVGRHTALGDAIVTAEILVKLIALLEAAGITTLGQAIEASAKSKFAKLSF